MKKMYDVTVREVRERSVKIPALSGEEAKRIVKESCHLHGFTTSADDVKSVSYEAVEQLPETVFEVEIKKVYTIKKSIAAYTKEQAVERAEIFYEDRDFDGEFDDSTLEVLFEAKEQKIKEKEPER